MTKDEIIKLIAERRAHIGVIGLGYVGLPLAVEFARRGFCATGFEVDAAKVEGINRGESHIGDVSSSAFIVTDHSDIDYKKVTALASLIVDTRNALDGNARRESHARIIRL